MDIRIRSVKGFGSTLGPEGIKCGTDVAVFPGDARKACGEPAEYRIDNLTAERKKQPSVGYVCGDHLGNVVEWYAGECK